MKLGLPIQWRLGGILLVVGGALSLVGAVIFNFGPQESGSLITIVGPFFEGVGLVVVSFALAAESVPRWARILLLVTGVGVIINFVVTASAAFGASIPLSVALILLVVLSAALLISAIAIYRGVPAGRPVRWALLPAAIFQAADFALYLSGYGGEWWTLAILGAMYILAGVVFAIRGPRTEAVA
jgi:hypothetical protein